MEVTRHRDACLQCEPVAAGVARSSAGASRNLSTDSRHAGACPAPARQTAARQPDTYHGVCAQAIHITYVYTPAAPEVSTACCAGQPVLKHANKTSLQLLPASLHQGCCFRLTRRPSKTLIQVAAGAMVLSNTLASMAAVACCCKRSASCCCCPWRGRTTRGFQVPPPHLPHATGATHWCRSQ